VLAAPARAKPSRKTAKVTPVRKSTSIPNLLVAAAAHVKATQSRKSLGNRNTRDEASDSNDSNNAHDTHELHSSPEMPLAFSQPRHNAFYDDEVTDDDEGKYVLFPSSTFANSRS
jgi:hypothetical protein